MSAHSLDAALGAVVAEQLRALTDRLPGMIAGAVREALAEREADVLLDTVGLAALLGCSPAALRMRLGRGSELASIAFTVDGRKRWRRSDVLALVRRR